MSATEQKVYQKMGVNYKARMGCDPEIFIRNKEGTLVGAEKVLPKGGINANYGRQTGKEGGKVIIDGVQAELNPAPQTCRAYMGQAIQACLLQLEKTLNKQGYEVSSDRVVQVPQEELESLSAENQRLGCGPSKNAYDTSATVKVTDKNKLMRCAGGHIHIETDQPRPEIMVPLLDLFVGNTSVLLDRDPMQVERRKMYGRAGEYRLPSHGIEYRTPSNYWLRSFQLMGFVMGLSRMALRLSNWDLFNSTEDFTYTTKHVTDALGYTMRYEYEWTPRPEAPAEQALIWLAENMNQKQVAEAINKNDFDLAMKNWQVTKEFVRLFIKDNPTPKASNDWFPLWPNMLDAFDYFVEKGIDYWWPEKDIIKAWKKLDSTEATHGHGNNWEGWFHKTVIPEYKKSQETKTV